MIDYKEGSVIIIKAILEYTSINYTFYHFIFLSLALALFVTLEIISSETVLHQPRFPALIFITANLNFLQVCLESPYIQKLEKPKSLI